MNPAQFSHKHSANWGLGGTTLYDGDEAQHFMGIYLCSRLAIGGMLVSQSKDIQGWVDDVEAR